MPLDNVENALIVDRTVRDNCTVKFLKSKGLIKQQSSIFCWHCCCFADSAWHCLALWRFMIFPWTNRPAFWTWLVVSTWDVYQPLLIPDDPSPWGTNKTILILLTVFYTDEDLHYEWDEVTVLDKNIAHFVLMSYEKSVTAQEFTSGMILQYSVTKFEKKALAKRWTEKNKLTETW